MTPDYENKTIYNIYDIAFNRTKVWEMVLDRTMLSRSSHKLSASRSDQVSIPLSMSKITERGTVIPHVLLTGHGNSTCLIEQGTVFPHVLLNRARLFHMSYQTGHGNSTFPIKLGTVIPHFLSTGHGIATCPIKQGTVFPHVLLNRARYFPMSY